MSLYRANLAVVLSAVLMASPAFAASTHRTLSGAHPGSTHPGTAHPSTTHPGSVHAKSSRKAISKPHKLHGQTAIEPERVTQIQDALIREHYRSAEANGKWDATTEAAMQKYQADQGWQTKLMPDSRALKKLGLGPDYSNAINAKNSSFADPPPVSTIPAEQASGFAEAAHVNH